jgi:hypothetical protein
MKQLDRMGKGEKGRWDAWKQEWRRREESVYPIFDNLTATLLN